MGPFSILSIFILGKCSTAPSRFGLFIFSFGHTFGRRNNGIALRLRRKNMAEFNLATRVVEATAGATAALKCTSNDDMHNFMFWQLGQNQIIGPGNDYDSHKYKYSVLSGHLMIKNVKPEEAGFYRCISKDLNRGSLNIGAVEMLVKPPGPILESAEDDGSDVEIIKIIFIIISVLIFLLCMFMIYRLKKEEKKLDSKLAAFDEDDDEGSGDEIYNRTTTVINNSVPTPSPSTYSKDHIAGIDNQGLDTDFNAAFEQIAINVANRNLV